MVHNGKSNWIGTSFENMINDQIVGTLDTPIYPLVMTNMAMENGP